MFEFLTDQNFLSALSLVIGPLAFFVAPCEEIELLLMSGDVAVDSSQAGLADAAAPPSDLATAQSYRFDSAL